MTFHFHYFFSSCKSYFLVDRFRTEVWNIYIFVKSTEIIGENFINITKEENRNSQK